jgi:hypothetical protein
MSQIGPSRGVGRSTLCFQAYKKLIIKGTILKSEPPLCHFSLAGYFIYPFLMAATFKGRIDE